MKFVVLALVVLVFMGCNGPIDDMKFEGQADMQPPSTTQVIPKQYGGLGMTYTGKIGLEIAPGIVMGFGGGIAPGFGF